jgi:ATP-dependent RNA helicase RhlE
VTTQTESPPPSDAALSTGSFADFGLRPQLLRAIEELGFDRPTPIQMRAIPPALAGQDLIGLAQTGTGKTLAFVLPGLDRLLRRPSAGPKPRMLVLTPTRELALQVSEAAERAAAHTGLSVAHVFGGRPMGPQVASLRAGPDLVVATPGRLLDHLKRRNVQLGGVEVLVLDEADRMLDMGFLDEVRAILRTTPATRQTFLFGATLPPGIESLSREFQSEPAIVEVARQKPPESIEQVFFPVEPHLKVDLLVHLLANEPRLESVIVFTEMKRDSDTLARQLGEAGLEVALLHGDRRQSDRESALAGLREGRVKILVATNIAARGLDIDDISHVINFDMPNTVDEYVHRIGRTARAHNKGRAYSFVTYDDSGIVARIEAALERTLPRRYAEGFDYAVPTPSWARPSSAAVQAALTKPKGRADVSRGIRRR